MSKSIQNTHDLVQASLEKIAAHSQIRKLTTDSAEVIALEDLLDLLDVPRFRKNLRSLLVRYLMHEHDNLMPDFEYFVEDMKFFFEFLDILNGEGKPKGSCR